jgi:hypothetical protein
VVDYLNCTLTVLKVEVVNVDVSIFIHILADQNPCLTIREVETIIGIVTGLSTAVENTTGAVADLGNTTQQSATQQTSAWDEIIGRLDMSPRRSCSSSGVEVILVFF